LADRKRRIETQEGTDNTSHQLMVRKSILCRPLSVHSWSGKLLPSKVQWDWLFKRKESVCGRPKLKTKAETHELSMNTLIAGLQCSLVTLKATALTFLTQQPLKKDTLFSNNVKSALPPPVSHVLKIFLFHV